MSTSPLALLLASCLLLPATSCGSDPEPRRPDIVSAIEDPPQHGETWRYRPVNHETRRFVNRMRGFFFDSDLTFTISPDATSFEARGEEEELVLLRRLVGVFDSGMITPDHVSGVWDIENRDARFMLNSARSRPEWRRKWIVLAPTKSRIYASIPSRDAETFADLIEELDQRQ